MMKFKNNRSFLVALVTCMSIGLCLVAVPTCDSSRRSSRRKTSCSVAGRQEVVTVPEKPKKQVFFTKKMVEEQMGAFNKDIDHACKKCSLGNCVPNFFLSDIDKRRLKLCPRLNEMKKNRAALLEELRSVESVDYINTILDDFKDSLAHVDSELSKEDRENLFHDILDCQHEQDITHAQSMALGFLYWWIFRFKGSIE
jgi:hypothetical protein